MALTAFRSKYQSPTDSATVLPLSLGESGANQVSCLSDWQWAKHELMNRPFWVEAEKDFTTFTILLLKSTIQIDIRTKMYRINKPWINDWYIRRCEPKKSHLGRTGFEMSYNESDLMCMVSKSRFCQQMEELSSLVPDDVYNYFCVMRIKRLEATLSDDYSWRKWLLFTCQAS